MSSHYEAPAYKAKKFTCPHCGALAHMDWQTMYPLDRDCAGNEFSNFWSAAICAACGDQSLWLTKSDEPAAIATGSGLEMCYPILPVGAPPTLDMPEVILKDYNEARQVAAASPRAAAALLRLCVQKLCKFLGEAGININEDIRSLVKAGLSVHAQRALDTIRLFGNSAVHPGDLTNEEVENAVPTLFLVVAYIVDDLITKPRLIDETYGKTPQSARQSLERTDAKAKSTAGPA